MQNLDRSASSMNQQTRRGGMCYSHHILHQRNSIEVIKFRYISLHDSQTTMWKHMKLYAVEGNYAAP